MAPVFDTALLNNPRTNEPSVSKISVKRHQQVQELHDTSFKICISYRREWA